MAAQDGASVLLAYGEQGSRQLGGSVVLQTLAVVTGPRTIGTTTRNPWAASDDLIGFTQAPFDIAATRDITDASPWPQGIDLDVRDRAAWGLTQPRDRSDGVPWGHYEGHLAPEPRVVWGVSARRDRRGGVPWGHYEGHPLPQTRLPWGVALRRDRRDGVPWGGPMLPVSLREVVRFARGVPADREQWIPWSRYSTLLDSELVIVIPVHSGDPEALYVVPVRSTYMAVNSASLRRVDGDIPLPTFTASMSLDYASWAWQFNVTLPINTLSIIEPNSDGDPVEMELTINGTAFRILAESISRERVFGKNSITLGGRSKAAVLDAPYSQVLDFGNTEDRTAQQLMGDVLTEAGESIGWDVTFNADDWLVPTGLFSYRGTRISALNQIAGAAGLYVQPHATDQMLIVNAKYPVAPWSWGTVEPDYELPSALMTREGIQWTEKPRYNRVFVSGTRDGILGQVTVTGTAGDILAPMVTDPLICAVNAARQRGLAILGDTGRMADTSLKLPVLAETGIIVPGKFVRYIDGATTRIGLVRSVALDVGMPEVWQTIGVETHGF